jgi:hypothetical protein
MKFNSFTSRLITSAAALALMGVCANSASAKNLQSNKGFKVISVTTLDNAKTSDLFLLKDQGGRQFLYLASADGKLSIFDVTHPSELRELSSWTLARGGSQTFRVEPISDRFAIASDSKTDENVTLLDLSNTPSEVIAKRFKDADAYAVDGDKQVLYVAQPGELTVVRFDRPITRDAERWEQSFEAR